MILRGICKIGVLGGIGPEATSEFYYKLIRELQRKDLIKKNEDFPQIIINSIPAPELISNNISQEELQVYLDGLKELELMKVDFIVMICNTIHLFHKELQTHIKVPILNLKYELKKYLVKNKVNKTLIIGTPLTIKKGLYEFSEIKSFKPNNSEIKILSRAIFNFNKGYKKEIQIIKSKNICEKYLKKGAKIVILGCTEFSVMLSKENMPTINTINVLVEACINKFILNKKFYIDKKKGDLHE